MSLLLPLTLLFLLIFIPMTAEASAVAPAMAWNKTYLADNDSYGQMIALTDDGYIIVPARTVGKADFSLIKTDFDGRLIWSRTYDDNLTEAGWIVLSSAIAVGDGYVLTGGKLIHDYTPYIAMVDRNGNLARSIMYGHAGNGYISGAFDSVVPADGSFVFAGYVGRYHPGSYVRSFIAMTDPEINEIWNRTYPAPHALERIKEVDPITQFDQIPGSEFTMALASGDGFLFAGKANESIWLVKTDREGYEVWNKTYGSSQVIDIVNATDGYVLLDRSHLVKIDSNGNIVWEHEIGEYTPEPSGYTINALAAASDGYVLAGQTDGLDNKTNKVLLAGTDLKGNVKWNATYAQDHYVRVDDLIVDHGTFIVAGTAIVNRSDNEGMPFLLKTRGDDPGATPATTATSPILMLLILAVVAATVRRTK
jgi:hypothetical protein